tara:strand:- start:604 stop:1329 length:726 start_codon:yes stop_codon:yes gene_type:complete
MKPKISCVISCYNEEKNIPKLILDIKKHKLNKYIFFIIVNNGSVDNSKNIIKKFSKKKISNIKYINLKYNKGWGNGIIQGLKNTHTKIIGWTHGDLEYKLSDLLKVIKIIHKNPKIFEREKKFHIKGKRINRTLSKKVVSNFMSIICSIILNNNLSEINAQPFFFNRMEFKTWKKIPKDLSLDMFAYNKTCGTDSKSIRINVEQLERIHGSSSWNKSFFSKFKLAGLFIKRAIQIKLCHYL